MKKQPLFFQKMRSNALIWLSLAVLLFIAACSDSPEVTVEEFTPQDEVSRTTNFTVVFSENVVGDSLINMPLEDAPIVFEPAIPGRFQWVATDKVRFFPDVMLVPSTLYRAEVQPGLTANHGLVLTGERAFTFQTARLRVSDAYLSFEYNNTSNDQARLVGRLAFNYDVDPREVLENVMLQYEDGSPISYELVSKDIGTVMELRAEEVERAEEDRQIELVVSSNMVGVLGSLGLEDEFRHPVSLPGQNSLKVEHVTAVRESAESQYVRVRFNLPVQPEDAQTYITISPNVNWRSSSSYNALQLRGDFASDQTYQITLRRGLLALDGTSLSRDFSTSLTFRQEDIPPQVDIVGNGYYLTRSGQLNLGLSTINMDKVSLEVDKVYANNLVQVLNAYDLNNADGYYYYGADISAVGRRVHSEDFVVPLQRNEEVITPLPLEDYIQGERKGIFKVTAREQDRRWRSVSRWVVATDLGMVTKEAGHDLWVWVNSLATLAPLEQVAITLYSRNNQELVTARTNEDGIAILKDYARYKDEFTPYVLTAELGNDLSFVELTRRHLATADFDVGGKTYLIGGYEAFLYNERGVYRPGEKAHLGAVVRGPYGAVPTAFPIRFRVTGPDGKVLSEQRATLNEQGGSSFEVDVPEYALTGRYRASLLLGDESEIGQTQFSIEEFVPDRMKVTLSTEEQAYRPGEEVRVKVQGLTLFGPPASGRRLQTKVEIEELPFSPPDYQSFSFGEATKSFTPVKAELEEHVLDAEGHGDVGYVIPNNLKPPSSLRAVVEATVLEPGGRGVTAYGGAVVHPYESYIGLRQTREGYAEPGKNFDVDFVLLDPSGQPIANRDLQVSLYYNHWNTIWRRADDGKYRYVSERVEVVEHTSMVQSDGGVGRLSMVPLEYGSYRLLVEDKTTGASTDYSFYSSGWGNAAWSLDSPDRIKMELDKEEYRPGESAQVLIQAPFPGKVLLTIEREKIYDHRIITLEENSATVDLPISGTYKPNVYVSAHLIRSTDNLERDESARAFGVVPLFVDTESNKLEINLEAPTEIRPNGLLEVDYQVSGGSGASFLTIAAVDEGITQLTDFQPPDPHGFFYGKKRLEVETADLYGVLLPEAISTLSSPSGDIEASRKKRVSPVAARRVKPIAFWSGEIEADARGRGQVSFDIPQFNGTVRLMAVAYAGDQYGHAEKKVLVRDPIVLTPTFPRFVSSGDSFVVPVRLYNGTGAEGEFTVQLLAEGPAQVEGEDKQLVTISAGSEGQLYFPVTSDVAMGVATFTLKVNGGGEDSEERVEVPVRPPVPYTTIAGAGSIEAGSVAQLSIPDDFIDGTDKFELVLSSLPSIRFGRSLRYLLQYPHGCVEQTTSRLFPLLVFNDLVRLVEPDLFATQSADYYLDEGIAKLERMQMSSGAFSYWPGGSYSNTWGSVYASHFLVEARKNGYVVSDRVYDSLIAFLKQVARDYNNRNRQSLAQAIYATYVLALAGLPDRSSMLYLKNNSIEAINVESLFQLAGAFALSGDTGTAKSLLPSAAAPPSPAPNRESGGNFYSSIRAQAIMLYILTEIEPASPQIPQLVDALSQSAEQGRWYTTQENAFAFLALGNVMRMQDDANFDGRLVVDGEPLHTFDEQNKRFASGEWAGKSLSIEVEGSGICYYYWRAEGLPSTTTVEEFDRDIRVRRRFLTESGAPITDLTSFQQGDLVIAELTINPGAESLDNVAVVDMLPTGLEIENPRLQSRAGIDWIADSAYEPDYLDIRDDRLILYGDFRAQKTETFYYGLRAITAGSFVLPPVRAEAMYAPMKASVSSGGRIVVRDDLSQSGAID